MPQEIIVVDKSLNFAGIDPTFAALHANLKPYEFKDASGNSIGGHYSMAMAYSNLAAKGVATGTIFSLRWNDSKFLMVLLRLVMRKIDTIAYTAAAAQDFSASKVTSYSTPASGGTNIGLGGTGQKARGASMNSSLLLSTGTVQLSSGDVLTAGVNTLDAQPFGWALFFNGAVLGLPQEQIMYENRDNGKHPMIFAQQEGFVIQSPIGNAQAAGVSKYAIIMDWLEVPAF